MRFFGSLLAAVFRRFSEIGCGELAAALTYSTLLALVPMMLVSFYVLSFFPFFHGVGKVLQQFIFANFVAPSARNVLSHLSIFLQQLRHLSWYNFAALLVVSILLMANMVSAFNRIWQVKLRAHYFALSFLVYLLVLLVMPLVFGVLIIGSSYLAFAWWTQPVYQFLPYIAEFVIFSFFNWVLPSCRVKVRYALIAGFLTMVLFEFTKWLFSLYINAVPTYRLVYGALAAIPIFLLWVYLVWLLVLLGGVVCFVLQHRVLSKKA